MKRRTLFILGALVGGCSGIDVSHDYDPDQDFTALKSWAWDPGDERRVEEVSRVSSLNHQRIRTAIQSELNRKQYRTADPKAADFLVRYRAAVGQRIESMPSTADGWYADDFRTYDEGTLVVEVLSAKDRSLLWRGEARTAIDFESAPDERTERIREAVREILAQFPPEMK
jgi:hypothetical protein